MLVLSVTIVLDCFYLRIFYFEKFSTKVYRKRYNNSPYWRIGFGRLCSKKRHIMLLAVLIFFLEIIPKLCYFLKIMLSVTEIMLLRFYIDLKENKDYQ